MWHARIGKCTAHDTRPGQLIRLERRRRTHVRFRIEPQTHHLEDLPQRSNHRGVEVLLTQTVEAGITLYALVAIDRRAFDLRIDVNSAHGAYVRAVTARHTLIGINLHFPTSTEYASPGRPQLNTKHFL